MGKDSDKKFLLKKIKLIVVGKPDQNLLDTIEYMGFSDITVIKSGMVAEALLHSTFFGFIVVYHKIEGEKPVEFIKNMRTDSTSISRFSPLLSVMDGTKITKELITQIRDAGATEMILEPYEIIPFREKILSMIENPRNFIIAREYAGPDRRRKKLDVDKERRKKPDGE